MSSKEKRKSSLLNPFGFGSSNGHNRSSPQPKTTTAYSRHQTIILPKDNEHISERDLPKRQLSLSDASSLPQVPQQHFDSRTVSTALSPITSAKPAHAKQQTPSFQPPAIAISPSTTNQLSQLDPARSIQSNLSAQRSNSPSTMDKRRSLIRKPPPPKMASPKITPVATPEIPKEQRKESSNGSGNKPVSKPELNKLITSMEGDVSDFNPSTGTGISPVPSSVYSPYSPNNPYNSNRTGSATMSKSASNLRSAESRQGTTSPEVNGQLSPGSFDEEFRKIEELLNQSNELNERVDEHLSHSRNSSYDHKKIKQDEVLISKNTTLEIHSEEDDEVQGSEEGEESKISQLSKDKGTTDLNSIIRDTPPLPKAAKFKNESSVVQDISAFGSPANAMQDRFASDLHLETTDDEFYDAENGEASHRVNTRGSDIPTQGPQEYKEDTAGIAVPGAYQFKVVNVSPSNASPDADDDEVSENDSENVESVEAHYNNTTVDVSSNDQTPEPPFPVESPRALRNKISMDVINGHGSELSHIGNNFFGEGDQGYDYEGNDYGYDEYESENEELDQLADSDKAADEDEDLTNRYLSQQEDFFQNQNTLSPETYVQTSPPYSSNSKFAHITSDGSSVNPPSIKISSDPRSVDNNSSKYQETSSSEETGDHQSEEDKLSFTARSPFYSPFEHIDDGAPRRMIVTNNVSDQESVDDDTELKDVANKRNSYFGDLNIDDYIAEEDAKASRAAQNTLEVPDTSERSRSPLLTPSDGPALSQMYDRREEPTVVPVAYSNPTSSASNPATSPGPGGHHLLEPAKPSKKPARRRPPPDFPVTGRSGRSLSVNQQQAPVFVEHAPLAEDMKTSSPTATNNERSSSNLDADQSPGRTQPVVHPGEGERSAYVMALRKKAGTSYSETGPPKWTLPIAIRAESEKNKTALSTKYSRTTMSLFKKGVLSSADIKHGNLKPRLLASEVDDDEILKANTAIGRSSESSSGAPSLAHTQLGSMIPPSRMSNELHLVPSKSNSNYSGTSNTSQHKRHSSLQYSMNDEGDYADYAVEEYRGNASQINSPRLDDISELNRASSVKSYAPGGGANAKLKLFVVNPDNEDSD